MATALSLRRRLPRVLDLADARRHRVLLFATALVGFGVLYVGARLFTGDYGVAGLSDDAIRTMAHFGVYGTLALLLAAALRGRGLLAWLLTVLLATAEETHQLFVQFRFACIGDWLVNVAGISAFLIAAALLHQHVARTRATPSAV